MEVAIIGGGNGAYAAAADLAEKGHRVRLWRRSAAELGTLLETGVLRLQDFRGVREVQLSLVSQDLACVIKGAQLIIVPLPATAQESVSENLAPYLEDGQVIYLTPGSSIQSGNQRFHRRKYFLQNGKTIL